MKLNEPKLTDNQKKSTHPTFTCSKSTIRILEKDLKCVQRY